MLYGTSRYSPVDCSCVSAWNNHSCPWDVCVSANCVRDQESCSSGNKALLVNTRNFCWWSACCVRSEHTWFLLMVCLLCAVWTHVIFVDGLFVVCSLNTRNYCRWSVFVVCSLNTNNYCWRSVFVACTYAIIVDEHKQLLLMVYAECNLNTNSYCWWSMLNAIWTQAVTVDCLR